MALILASSSPRRSALLSARNIAFQAIEPGVPELEQADDPRRLCLENARRKADAVAVRFPKDWVVGADTIVVLDGRVLGKPADLTEARRMLESLSGRTHEVLTGVALRGPGGGSDFIESTRVTFRKTDEATREAHLARARPLDKAGAYAVQEDDGTLIAAIEGCRENVIGLPVPRLLRALAKFSQ